MALLKKIIKNSFVFFFLTACQHSSYEFVQMRSVEDGKWSRSDTTTFIYKPSQSTSKNFYIYLENTGAYPYSNIYIIAKLDNGKSIEVDTLEYEMADGHGQWLGRKVAGHYENLLIYKWQYPVHDSIEYHIHLEPATRSIKNTEGDEYLPGITTIGLIIE